MIDREQERHAMQQHSVDLTRQSRPVVIVPYQQRWPVEYRELGAQLRSVLGDCALRIDHIGSTSVPGLGAKDVLDVQITVRDLEQMDEFKSRMRACGFQEREGFHHDCFSGPKAENSLDWRKRYFREVEGERRTHIHVRELGRLNQKYPLLFRDFLRSNETVHTAYELIKRRLAEIFPECIDGYLYIKDPLMDIIFEAGLLWADQVGWEPDEEHL